MNWVPEWKDLPKPHQKVLVYCYKKDNPRDWDILIGAWKKYDNQEYWYVNDDDIDWVVSHWGILPKPPKKSMDPKREIVRKEVSFFD